jgi:Primase C terminal 2 (PriCT-2)/RepB DNA-primase from phage plasmid
MSSDRPETHSSQTGPIPDGETLHVDIEQAARFLERLDPGARYFTFQTFDDNADRKDERLAKVLHGTLAQHAAELIRLNNKGAGIFITVNETNGRGRKEENIERIRAVFADLDGTPLEPVMQSNLTPQIIVETSPGRWHPYWLVKEMPLEDFTAVQLAIIERFHSDPVIHDLPRVMRLPGFIHRKGVPFMVRIHSIHDAAPYPAKYFEKMERQPHISGEKQDATAKDLWLVGEALKVIPTSQEWGDRNYVGMAVWRATDGAEYGFEAWSAWLQRSGKYGAWHTRRQWRNYFRSQPKQLGIGTLIFYADLVEPGWYERVNEELDDVMGGGGNA